MVIAMKKARILLRVSSNQQLEADGDLSVQRRLVLDYVQAHDDWKLDGKEYFEGSKSGYKTAVSERDTLQVNMIFWLLIRMTESAGVCGKWAYIS